jgi:hypothetical protein
LSIILLVLVAVIIITLLFKLKSPAATDSVARPKSTLTNATTVPNLSQKLLDVGKAQSIVDWTNAIPDFKISTHTAYVDSWVMEQDNPAKYPSVLLTGKSNETIQYKSDFIDIEITDRIRRIEIHSPNLNVEDVKTLGDSLLRLMGKDEENFNAWCDKVGNRWMDQPQFSSGNAYFPNGGKTYGFQTLPTFNNEKPWYILLVITDP